MPRQGFADVGVVPGAGIARHAPQTQALIFLRILCRNLPSEYAPSPFAGLPSLARSALIALCPLFLPM